MRFYDVQQLAENFRAKKCSSYTEPQISLDWILLVRFELCFANYLSQKD